LTDPILTRFYWLSVAQPAKGQGLEAKLGDNTVQITTHGVKQFSLGLDGRLVSFDRPLRVTLDGKTQAVEVRPSFRTLCRSMLERGDPELAFTCQVRLDAGKK